MAMSQQQALRVLNRRVKPLGEEIISVQKGKNSFEQKLLRDAGGAGIDLKLDGKKTKSGLRSYFLSGLLGGGGQQQQTSTSSVELDPEVKKDEGQDSFNGRRGGRSRIPEV